MRIPWRFGAGLALATLTWSALAADPLQVRSLAAACFNCHGTQGAAQDGMPSLAGQERTHLLQMLLDYKSGKLPATVMQQLAKGYTDEQLEQLAGYFAAQKR